MNVLIAPDKFKGSLTAAQVVHNLGSGLEQRGVHYDGLPLADGGDGSVAAAVAAGFRSVEVDVAIATGERHSAAIAFDGVTAVVEVANTCGLHTLHVGTPALLRSSSAGLGDAVVLHSSSRRSGSSWRSVGRPARTADGNARRPRAVFRDEAGQPVTPEAARSGGSTPSTSPECPT
jgi:glycerate kinase